MEEKKKCFPVKSTRTEELVTHHTFSIMSVASSQAVPVSIEHGLALSNCVGLENQVHRPGTNLSATINYTQIELFCQWKPVSNSACELY